MNDFAQPPLTTDSANPDGGGTATADPDEFDVVLEGGPADLPDALRRRRVTGTTDRIKVMFRGGYEHFHRDISVPATVPVVYRWAGRTRIAE
ncbi:DUF5988 family protein [Micromonospora sp. FIMYZ51]|uniref:DUF5988 family protein n=1 Tax=Micromonospora sp. FIMYZ51 TaxID=3051832 RepID=UPI00311F14D4